MGSSEHELELLWTQAKAYVAEDDAYSAMKLLRRIVRLKPEWAEPYHAMGKLFKTRKDWKGAFYHFKKAVSLHTKCPEWWLDLALSAEALKKNRLAGSIWKKFNAPKKKSPLVAFRTNQVNWCEIVPGRQVDPAKGFITGVPSPESGFKFKDEVLTDYTPCGWSITSHTKYPVFDILDMLKPSHYGTFSCMIHSDKDSAALEKLRELCRCNDLGFDNWSAITAEADFIFTPYSKEYYGAEIHAGLSNAAPVLVGLAAKKEKDALDCLKTWKIITLQDFSHFRRY